MSVYFKFVCYSDWISLSFPDSKWLEIESSNACSALIKHFILSKDFDRGGYFGFVAEGNEQYDWPDVTCDVLLRMLKIYETRHEEFNEIIGIGWAREMFRRANRTDELSKTWLMN